MFFPNLFSSHLRKLKGAVESAFLFIKNAVIFKITALLARILRFHQFFILCRLFRNWQCVQKHRRPLFQSHLRKLFLQNPFPAE
jgi:hypothetical protein